MSSYREDVIDRGFSVTPTVVEGVTTQTLIDEISFVLESNRAQTRPGLRNLLTLSARCRELSTECLRDLVWPVLGERARVVRGLYFDKHRDANWKVAWHQDLTIAVKQKAELEGYGPWSRKGGIVHVQPPVSVLERMLTVRLHLDDTDETNGALRVIPGSHRLGRLSADEIQECIRRAESEVCIVRKGGAMLMRPLLLHSSSTSQLLRQRRVVHLEYCAAELPEELEWNEDTR